MPTMNSNRELYLNTGTAQRLRDLLVATVRYIPLLTALLAVGLGGLYALASYGILGTPAPQLLIAAGISFAVGLAHLSIDWLVRRDRTWFGLGLFWALLGVWSVSIVVLWEFAAPIAVIMAWVAFLVALAAGVRGRRLAAYAAASAALSVGLIWLNAHPAGSRLATANPAGLAAIVLLASTVLTAFCVVRRRCARRKLVMSTHAPRQRTGTWPCVVSRKKVLLLHLSQRRCPSGCVTRISALEKPPPVGSSDDWNRRLAASRPYLWKTVSMESFRPVSTMPPFRELAPQPMLLVSSTATVLPRYARVRAAESPVKPPPTIGSM